MSFEILYVIFIVVTVLNYILQDIKIDKIKKESLDKDKVIGSLMAHNSVLRRLNEGYKDHERRVDNIEKLIGKCISSLPEKPEEPKEPEKPKYTCEDCKFYHPYNGIGFTDAINLGFSNGITYFKCEKMGCSYPIDCDGTCQLFEKEESLDEDENVVYYANNVKVDISSKAPHVVYKTDKILTYEEFSDRISRLFLDGGISYADMNALVERLKQ